MKENNATLSNEPGVCNIAELQCGVQRQSNGRTVTDQSYTSNRKSNITFAKSEVVDSNLTGDGKLFNIRGSYHQGDPIFDGNAGKQCLVSFIYTQIKKSSMWECFDIDNILQIGNDLYTILQGSTAISDNYLLVNELPVAVELFDTMFTLNIGESSSGIIGKTGDVFKASAFVMNLDNALWNTLIQFEACFVTFAASTFMMMKSDGCYFVFDSHSRNVNGHFDSDGTSILLKFRNLIDVYQHCCSLASSMDIQENSPFEVTGINVVANERHDVNLELPRISSLKENPQKCQDTIPDELVIGEIEQIPIHFNTLTSKDFDVLCSNLGIRNEHHAMKNRHPCHNEIGDPLKTKSIKGDGNCFFRALSFAISGTECNHCLMRQVIVEHLGNNYQTYECYIRPEFGSVKAYIRQSCIGNESTWATEVEIFVAAYLLGCDIYTFSENAWLKFPYKSKSNDKRIQGTIYLNHYRMMWS